MKEWEEEKESERKSEKAGARKRTTKGMTEEKRKNRMEREKLRTKCRTNEKWMDNIEKLGTNVRHEEMEYEFGLFHLPSDHVYIWHLPENVKWLLSNLQRRKDQSCM